MMMQIVIDKKVDSRLTTFLIFPDLPHLENLTFPAFLVNLPFQKQTVVKQRSILFPYPFNFIVVVMNMSMNIFYVDMFNLINMA